MKRKQQENIMNKALRDAPLCHNNHDSYNSLNVYRFDNEILDEWVFYRHGTDNLSLLN